MAFTGHFAQAPRRPRDGAGSRRDPRWPTPLRVPRPGRGSRSVTSLSEGPSDGRSYPPAADRFPSQGVPAGSSRPQRTTLASTRGPSPGLRAPRLGRLSADPGPSRPVLSPPVLRGEAASLGTVSSRVPSGRPDRAHQPNQDTSQEFANRLLRLPLVEGSSLEKTQRRRRRPAPSLIIFCRDWTGLGFGLVPEAALRSPAMPTPSPVPPPRLDERHNRS